VASFSLALSPLSIHPSHYLAHLSAAGGLTEQSISVVISEASLQTASLKHMKNALKGIGHLKKKTFFIFLKFTHERRMLSNHA